jgi:hypothetical protein
MIVGTRYGKLVVIAVDVAVEYRHRRVLCKCACGKECVVRVSNLTSGWTRSCGHLRGRHKHSDETKAKLSALRRARRKEVQHDCAI